MTGQSVKSLVHKMTGTWNKGQRNKPCDEGMGIQVPPMVKQG